jgi:hypothetical protein
MPLPTLLAAGVTAAGLAFMTASPAQESSTCDDAVAGALHTLHDMTGDPGGLVHEVEDTYCSAAP